MLIFHEHRLDIDDSATGIQGFGKLSEEYEAKVAAIAAQHEIDLKELREAAERVRKPGSRFLQAQVRN